MSNPTREQRSLNREKGNEMLHPPSRAFNLLLNQGDTAPPAAAPTNSVLFPLSSGDGEPSTLPPNKVLYPHILNPYTAEPSGRTISSDSMNHQSKEGSDTLPQKIAEPRSMTPVSINSEASGEKSLDTISLSSTYFNRGAPPKIDVDPGTPPQNKDYVGISQTSNSLSEGSSALVPYNPKADNRPAMPDAKGSSRAPRDLVSSNYKSLLNPSQISLLHRSVRDKKSAELTGMGQYPPESSRNFGETASARALNLKKGKDKENTPPFTSVGNRSLTSLNAQASDSKSRYPLMPLNLNIDNQTGSADFHNYHEDFIQPDGHQFTNQPLANATDQTKQTTENRQPGTEVVRSTLKKIRFAIVRDDTLKDHLIKEQGKSEARVEKDRETVDTFYEQLGIGRNIEAYDINDYNSIIDELSRNKVKNGFLNANLLYDIEETKIVDNFISKFHEFSCKIDALKDKEPQNAPIIYFDIAQQFLKTAKDVLSPNYFEKLKYIQNMHNDHFTINGSSPLIANSPLIALKQDSARFLEEAKNHLHAAAAKRKMANNLYDKFKIKDMLTFTDLEDLQTIDAEYLTNSENDRFVFELNLEYNRIEREIKRIEAKYPPKQDKTNKNESSSDSVNSHQLQSIHPRNIPSKATEDPETSKAMGDPETSEGTEESEGIEMHAEYLDAPHVQQVLEDYVADGDNNTSDIGKEKELLKSNQRIIEQAITEREDNFYANLKNVESALYTVENTIGGYQFTRANAKIKYDLARAERERFERLSKTEHNLDAGQSSSKHNSSDSLKQTPDITVEDPDGLEIQTDASEAGKSPKLSSNSPLHEHTNDKKTPMDPKEQYAQLIENEQDAQKVFADAEGHLELVKHHVNMTQKLYDIAYKLYERSLADTKKYREDIQENDKEYIKDRTSALKEKIKQRNEIRLKLVDLAVELAKERIRYETGLEKMETFRLIQAANMRHMFAILALNGFGTASSGASQMFNAAKNQVAGQLLS